MLFFFFFFVCWSRSEGGGPRGGGGGGGGQKRKHHIGVPSHANSIAYKEKGDLAFRLFCQWELAQSAWASANIAPMKGQSAEREARVIYS